MDKIWKLIPIIVISFFSLLMLKSITLDITNIIFMSLSILILILFSLLSPKLKLKNLSNSLSDKKAKSILAVIIIVHTIVMLIFSFLLISEPKNDLGTIYHSALEIVNTGHINTEIDENTSCYHFYGFSNNDYFVAYPNNIMILIIITAIYAVINFIGIPLTLSTTLISAQIFNIFCIELTIILATLLLSKKYDNYTSFKFIGLVLIFLPFYINSFRFYTDTIVMPFLVLILYLTDYLGNNFSGWKNILLWFLYAIILFIAIQIKLNAAIVLIALIIFYILKGNKKYLLNVSIFVVPTYILLSFLFNHYIHNTDWIDFKNEETLKFPALHWIALGMTGDGGYNQSLVELEIQNVTTVAEKQEIILNVLKDKFSNYNNPLEFIDFEFKKAVDTWSDGKYYQYVHMEWGYNYNIIHQFILPNGAYFDSFNAITKTFAFTIIITFIISSIYTLNRNKLSYETLLVLIVLGIALFLCMSETKSRYLLAFTPVFLMLLSLNIDKFNMPNKEIFIKKS